MCIFIHVNINIHIKINVNMYIYMYIDTSSPCWVVFSMASTAPPVYARTSHSNPDDAQEERHAAAHPVHQPLIQESCRA